MKKDIVAALLTVCFLAGVAAFALYSQRPPNPLPASAPQSEFSAERAIRHIETFAREPHPLGSPQNAKVRDYLLKTLTEMGYAPQVQRDTFVPLGSFGLARPENVLARLDGANPTKSVVLMAHYDSVPYGPGAADDGSGVATLLETARVLKCVPPLRNSVIFLFTDGEEGGLRGARAFLDGHPWMDEVGLVLNFDVRGVRGPTYMYQPSKRNGAVIRGLIQADPYPNASSLMYDISSRMPTNSDYEVMRDADVPGLDFGCIEGIAYYHTQNDTPEHLSRASLQHFGYHATSLVQHFGNLDTSNLRDEDLTYFNTLGPKMVQYSHSLARPLAVVSACLVAFALLLGLVCKAFPFGGLLRALVSLPFALLYVLLMNFLAVSIGLEFNGVYLIYNYTSLLIGCVILTAGLFYLYYVARPARRIPPEAVYAAALAWMVVPLALTAQFLPNGSFLYTWPLFFSALGAVLWFSSARVRASWAGIAILNLTAAPVILLEVPSIYSFTQALPIVFLPVFMAAAAWMLGLLAAHLGLISRGVRVRPWVAAVLFAVPALGFLGFAWFNTSRNAERPLMNYLSYGLDLDTQKACWFSRETKPDEWTSQFFPPKPELDTIAEFEPRSTAMYAKSDAALAPITPSQITKLADSVENGRRKLVLRVQPADGVSEFSLYAGPETPVFGAKINGSVAFTRSGGRHHLDWRFRFAGRAESGIDLELTVDAGKPAAFKLVETRYGLPEIPEHPYKPRPDYMIPMTNTMPQVDLSWEALRSLDLYHRILRFNQGLGSQRTFVAKTFAFPG